MVAASQARKHGRSAERITRMDIPVILPEIDDARDACVERLIRLLQRRDGVRSVHVVSSGAASDEPAPNAEAQRPRDGASFELCLHYDAERLTLTQIEALAKAAGAAITDRYAHAVIPFRSVGSEDSGQRLEAELRDLPGVTAAAVNYAGQVARVEFDRRRIDRAAIEARLAVAGGGKREDGRDAKPGEENVGWYARNRELAWSLLAGALLSAGWLVGRIADAQSAVPIALYIAAYFFGARDNVGHFLADLRRGRFHFNIDLLMVVAALGAAILGEWVEGALLLFLFSLGHALEHYALGRARNAIAALADLAPQRAIVIRDGGEFEVAIEDVRPGDQVLVKPAERIPVDGLVREGRSAVNQAPITGESVPVDKAPGEKVFAGSVNGDGVLVIDVTVAVGDRTLDRVIRLVAEAQTQKAPTQQFTDRFERWFVPLVLITDALLIVGPPVLGLSSWSESFYRGMALLVAASPCALALGTPAAVLAGIAQAARNGVLIKGGAHLEMLGAVKTLALDKTGTITRGEPVVTDVRPTAGVDEARLLTVTAAVERRSQHPLASAIIAVAEERELPVLPAGEVESVTGRGIRATIDGVMVEAGRLLMFEEQGAEVPQRIRDDVAELEENGRTTIVVRTSAAGAVADAAPGTSAAREEWLGVIGIADEPREGVADTLDRLRALGIERIIMLTGDNPGVGNAVGRAVGISEVRASLLPEDKVAAIEELARDGRVAMVGDGVNDAPALAHASVGIAMGGAGTAAALETADVALMGDDLGRLPFAVGLSRRARAIIKQNLAVSLGVIGLLVVATTTGTIGIGPAVIVHEGSTLIVIANALRLLAHRAA